MTQVDDDAARVLERLQQDPNTYQHAEDLRYLTGNEQPRLGDAVREIREQGHDVQRCHLDDDHAPDPDRPGWHYVLRHS